MFIRHYLLSLRPVIVSILSMNISQKKEIQQLTIRLRNGDAKAFHELYLYFAPILYRYVYSLLHSKEDTEDILHNVFCKIWEMRNTLKDNTNFEAFLVTVSKNSAYNLFKSKYYSSILKESKLEKDITSIANNNGNIVNGESNIIGNDLSNYLGKIIDALPPRRKEIFILNRFKGLTYKEIAENLQISENTVDTQMRKALAYIKENLGNELIVILLTFIGLD